ncbi:NAD(P)H-binding protein [Terrabacter sp. C0L_2]|uniref:NAD(P)H-binding protein n=1 Tax=Terrabacter sp. C0L_2 TaxID=3108389 RepID=UPI002ED5E882|nr:NAD(P)H-binding protein [Terrabacter sp. C0L_2]
MILLVGGTGTVGSHVAKALANRTDVRVLARSEKSAHLIEQLGLKAVPGDLSRPGTLSAVFEGVTRVFLATPRADQLDNEWNAIEAAERAGVERLVKVSLVYAGEPPVPYLRRPHDLLEARLATSPILSTILRPPAFMSHLLAQLNQITSGRIVFPAGDVRIAHVDPRDVADVAVEALVGQQDLNGPLVVTGPRSLSFDEVAEDITEVLGQEVRYIDESAPRWREQAVAGGSPEWLADGLVEMFADYAARGGVPASGVVDHVLGRPARSVHQFAEELLQPAIASLLPAVSQARES